MAKIALIVVLFIGLALGQIVHDQTGFTGYKCVHDSLFNDIDLKVLGEENKEKARILQAPVSSNTSGSEEAPIQVDVVDGWHNMRIVLDFSFAEDLIKSNPTLGAKYQMSIRLLESVRNYFGKYMQVNYEKVMKFDGGACQGNTIAAFTKAADLFITIKPENNPQTQYFAAAAPCYLSPRDYRPVIGAYILNFAFLETSYVNEYLYFSTFAHEFTHILGFSKFLFPKFVVAGTKTPRTDVLGNMTIGNETFGAIVLPELADYARKYFDCSSINGMPLENNGGDGSANSHWEKLFLPSEYMNPTVENPGYLSQFTFTLLRASGWYIIDKNASQRYDWGQLAGCRHFEICPKNSAGYCQAEDSMATKCHSEYMGQVISFYDKAVCLQETSFSSGCYVKRAKKHSCLLAGSFTAGANEYYGSGARCINYKATSGTYGTQCHKTKVPVCNPVQQQSN